MYFLIIYKNKFKIKNLEFVFLVKGYLFFLNKYFCFSFTKIKLIKVIEQVKMADLIFL